MTGEDTEKCGDVGEGSQGPELAVFVSFVT